VRRRWPVRMAGLLALALMALAPLRLESGVRRDLPRFALDPEVERIARYLEQRAPGSLEPSLRRQVAVAVTEESRLASLDPLLVLAVIEVESDFIPDAVSNASAKGLMQLRDVTVREIVKHEELPAKAALEAPEVVELRLGIRYLARMLRKFPNQARALAAWNAGPGAVGRELAATGEVPERWLAFARRVDREHRRLQARFRKDDAPKLAQVGAGAATGSPLD